MILYVRARCNIFLLYSVHYEMNDKNFIFFSLLILLVDEEAKKNSSLFPIKCREVHGRAEGSNKTPKSAAGLFFLRTDVTRGVLHTQKKLRFSFLFFSFFGKSRISYTKYISNHWQRLVPCCAAAFHYIARELKIEKRDGTFFFSLFFFFIFILCSLERRDWNLGEKKKSSSYVKKKKPRVFELRARGTAGAIHSLIHSLTHFSRCDDDVHVSVKLGKVSFFFICTTNE